MLKDGTLPYYCTMATAVTQDIHISVRTRFDAARSDAIAGRFLHSYHITITNNGRDAVRLLRRHWYINDGAAGNHEVEGPGVVGETPTILPGGSYSYSSACDLRGSLGRMAGSYTMERLHDGHRFQVRIPLFVLQHPPTLN